jgi:putative hydrolase of the HAD superfamily
MADTCIMTTQPLWIFDLDNTLHDANPHVFPHINRLMSEYIERHLRLSATAASALRQHYWQRYGATLLGLVRHHGVDPAHFLQETHRFADLQKMLVFDPALPGRLKQLAGRKVVFSNAPRQYSEAVLRLTGLAGCFDRLYPVESTRLQPKPLLGGFWQVLRGERVSPQCCIMVEDSLPNLVTAKRLGMKTVWVARSLRGAACVDLKVRSAAALPGVQYRLIGKDVPAMPQ